MNPTTSILRITQTATVLGRYLNCWSVGITKIHRKIYERTYPTILVQPDGSSIVIPYFEPRKIIHLPLDLSKLSEAQRKARLDRRRKKTVVKLEEDIEDDFDESKYIIFKRN